MRLWSLIVCLLLLSSASDAKDSAGSIALQQLKQCIMQNDEALCTRTLTPASQTWLKKFMGYKLMPCLPTNFGFDSEETYGNGLLVKAAMPAGEGKRHVARLMFVPTYEGYKLDLPATLQRGLGDKWEEKMQMAEQLYLLMQQNMQGKLTCDMLVGLIRPPKPASTQAKNIP